MAEQKKRTVVQRIRDAVNAGRSIRLGPEDLNELYLQDAALHQRCVNDDDEDEERSSSGRS